VRLRVALEGPEGAQARAEGLLELFFDPAPNGVSTGAAIFASALEIDADFGA
jgi:hypothetical protein